MPATAQDLLDFVAASPSPYHAVERARERLEAAGFVAFDERVEQEAVAPGDGGYLVRGGSLIAWRAGVEPAPEAGFRVLVAHTDSPNLRLMPNPEAQREGQVAWHVEPYGGVLAATWSDRDLGLSGRVSVREGNGVGLRLVRVDKPLARIPNVAIHLNRQVNTEGLKLDFARQLVPLVGQGSADELSVKALVAQTLDLDDNDILAWDLMFHDVQPPSLGGWNDEFVFAPRMDNQFCCFAALDAIVQAELGAPTMVVALFDHEEVGSRSASGADSVMLRYVLERLLRRGTEQAPGGLQRASAHSYCVSADMAHGVHPNYADLHDGRHRPVMNGGPVIKTNARQRYSTDAETAGLFRQVCEEQEVPVQDFLCRPDLACGSTVGPFCASRLGIRTVDVGCAMLSMHSAREQAGAADVALLGQVFERVLAGRERIR